MNKNDWIIKIDKDLCICCGSCMDVCVGNVLEENSGTIKAYAPARCILCGHCKAVCPENAIEFQGLDSDEFSPLPEKNKIFSPDQLQTFFRSRRSIRKYKKRPVEKELIEKIIEAGRFAPTGGNRQPVEHAVVHTPDMMQKVLETTVETLAEMSVYVKRKYEKEKKSKRLSVSGLREQYYADLWLKIKADLEKGVDSLFYHAPVLIASHVNPENATTPGVDAGIAGAHMTLMAEALGLGACFCGFFVLAVENNPDLKQVMKIPVKNRVQFSFMAGYPDVGFLRLTGRKPASVTWI